MREKSLGRTDLKVRILGFGGIPIRRISEEEAVKVIRHSYELGVNYFDTARAYGVSEERIGKALEDVRENVVLATKTVCRSREGVLEDLNTSLRNLRTGLIDVYQLHNVSSKEAWEQVTAPDGALEAIYEARDDEKIKYLGITSHNPAFITEIVKEGIFDTIMIPFNYMSTMPLDDLLPLCQKMKVGTVIMKPFGGGALSDAGTALKYVLGNEDVDVTIPGMMTLSEVEENVSVASGSYILTSEEQRLIKNDSLELGDRFCRACDYCQPCPQEIPISLLLRWELFEKRMGWSPDWVGKFEDALRKASTCIDCGTCESRCPYDLPIRKLLSQKTSTLRKTLNSK